jgi:hypothetical protein
MPTTPGESSKRVPFLGWKTRMPLVALSLAVFGVAAATVISTGGGSRKATIPAGSRLVGTLNHTVSTENSRVGESISLQTEEPLILSQGTVIPSGVVIRGEVTHAEGGGRIAGAPELTLRFPRLVIDGHSYDITADPFRVRGKSDLGESVAEIGGGTVIGAVVGGLKGAAVGAVLGTGVAVATKGNQIALPAGQRLRVRLAEPVTVRYKPESKES